MNGLTSEILKRLDTKICELIATTVGRPLPHHVTAYHRFAAWIGHIERISPAEIFTPNYDLLIEEALEHYKLPYFDGFVGTREPFFDLSAIEQDAIPNRWTRLWKMHGSINWIRRPDDSVYRAFPVPNGQQLLIYPSHLKYDQSRRMPYLAMIDRLRAFFRDIKQSSNPVLVICGYSFADDHLNEVLLDGLRANRSAHCFALMFTDMGDCQAAAVHATRNSNLSVLAKDGAVVRTRKGAYKPIDVESISPTEALEVMASEGGDEPGSMRNVRLRLGDFHHFTRFLESQFGVKLADQQNTETR